MQGRRKVFIILFSLTLLTGAPPVYATSITFEGGGAYRAVWGGVEYQDIIVDFGTLESRSPGPFNETASGSGVSSAGSVSGSAHQFSNISLLGDVLTVDATHVTSLTLSPTSPPPTIGFGGAAISNINILFTLHDWASYSTTGRLVGNVFTDPLQEVSLSRDLIGTEELVFSHFGSDIDGIRTGLLAPGTYRYNVLSAVHGPGQSTTMTTSFVVTNVPEPSSLLLLVSAIGLLATSRWRRWTYNKRTPLPK